MSDPPQTDPQPSITPIPLPSEGVGCVILFGGSFDPVTLAHTRMATEARRLAEPDAWLIFIPAARSPHKPDAPIPSDADRVEMLRLATKDIDRCTIWTDEIDRVRQARQDEPSYSINTIERARQVLGDHTRLRLLIGADQALNFHRWRDPQRILELAPPIVMPRNDLANSQALILALEQTSAWSDAELEQWGARLIDMPEIEASATHVRELLQQQAFESLQGIVHDRVLAHIRQRRIYTTP